MAERTDLIHRALRNLGVLPQGQAPSAEDYQSISDILDWVIADLENRNIIRGISADYPDDEFMLPLAHCVAAAAAPEFGQEQNQAIWALKERAEIDLKEIYNRTWLHDINRRTMRTDYPITCRPLTGTSWTNG
jgi:hypothetical protein